MVTAETLWVEEEKYNGSTKKIKQKVDLCIILLQKQYQDIQRRVSSDGDRADLGIRAAENIETTKQEQRKLSEKNVCGSKEREREQRAWG